MTTMARVDETLARFDCKSPREAYRQTCAELDVHMQRDIYNMLPSASLAFHRITSLELDKCLLGSKGCMALLPIVTVSTSLRKLSVRSCGISDEFVTELCEILDNHPSVRAVDIADNDLVTVHSAPPIIGLLKRNANIVNVEVDGTHVGDNVASIIASLSQKNALRVSTYYQDSYFKMKDLFGYLDEDGCGWVRLKSLVLHCPFPVLQEQFVERIAAKKPKKRSDNTISVNTFMQLVYMNYKTEWDIARYAEEDIDGPYVYMVANWKQVIAAVERVNASRPTPAFVREGDVEDKGTAAAAEVERERLPKIALPEKDFHRLRMREFLLTNEDADALVAGAIKLQLRDESGPAHTVEKGDADALLTVSIANLIRASKTAFLPPPSTKPEYHFYKERDAGFIPDLMRHGSRMMSMGDLDCLNASTRSMSMASSRASVVADPSDPERTFSLPSSIVRMIVEFFNRALNSLPKKKESVLPESPRTRKDKALQKAAIPIATFLSAEFITDFEKVCPRLLADYYSRYSLPIEDCTITLQEMVNVLDELYVQTRIDTIIPFETIRDSLESPLTAPRYADFISRHLLERDEDMPLIEPLRASASL